MFCCVYSPCHLSVCAGGPEESQPESAAGDHQDARQGLCHLLCTQSHLRPHPYLQSATTGVRSLSLFGSVWDYIYKLTSAKLANELGDVVNVPSGTIAILVASNVAA